ncbi:hypothetical protein [Krasilnikovia sp. MM14-A1259]|uniref:hypothetical protein n=1 Tax=Krasilnikovia sp. MM14-A1259 TaxID=3373539 RepID=UPI0038188681
MSRQAKPGSKAYRAQLRDRLSALGFPAEEIAARVAEHLIAECRIRPRTAWRSAREMSLDLAAQRYNSVNGGLRAGMRGSRIWEYEQWPDRGVRPTLAALRILAQVYGTTWKALLDLSDLDRLPPDDLAAYHGMTGEAPPPPPAADTARPAPDGEPLTPLAEALALTATNVDNAQLDDLWSDLNYLGNAYVGTLPVSILRQLSVIRERAVTLLKGRQRPKQTKELYLLSAKSSAMMAWISADLGNYGAAQELNSAAWLYGQYADDFLARRWVRTTQSRVEYWAGNGAESARLARDGLGYRVGKRITDAPLILAEARGWASIQAERQTLDAVERWARIEDADSTDTCEDRFFNISKDRRHYMAGTSLLSVGQAGRGLAELQNARQAYDGMPVEHRWEAMEPMIMIDTGRAHLRLGELDAAADDLAPFVSADLGPQPDMVRAMLKVLTRELDAPRWRGSTIAHGLADALLGVQKSIPQ